jgi:hypothetical protein
MNIVGFGDSFILGLKNTPKLEWLYPRSNWKHDSHPWHRCYQGMLGDHYKCIPEFRGLEGSGPWNAFFDFLEYQKTNTKKIDVVIMAWSESQRLYHPVVKPINTVLVERNRKKESEPFREIYQAAYEYYAHLMDTTKQNYELSGLMAMFDMMTQQYPGTKFINLHCFSWLDQNEWWNKYDKIGPTQLRYHHTFKHCSEIRPCLMYVSRRDGWPGDHFLHQETRECHLTVPMHRLLTDAIIDAIDNYEPGRIVDIPV